MAEESAMIPQSLLEIIENCRKIATVPEDAWTAHQTELQTSEALDELETSLPQGLAWSKFDDRGVLAPTPHGKSIGTSEGQLRSRNAVMCDNVVWMGPPAAGKSSLAAAAAREWVRRTHRAAIWVPSERLVLARLQHPAGRGEAPLVVRAMSVPLLVLDDLGAGASCPSDANGDVIRERVNANKPLWITTGLDVRQMSDRYDGRVLRRIFEHAMVIHLNS